MQTFYKGSNKETLAFINEHIFPYFDKIGSQRFLDSNESTYFIHGDDFSSKMKALFLTDSIKRFEDYGHPSRAHIAHMVLNDASSVVIESGGDMLARARSAIESSHRDMTHVFKIIGAAIAATSAVAVLVGAGMIATQPVDHNRMEMESQIMAIASEVQKPFDDDSFFTDDSMQRLVSSVSERLQNEGGQAYPNHALIRKIVTEESLHILNESKQEKSLEHSY